VSQLHHGPDAWGRGTQITPGLKNTQVVKFPGIGHAVLPKSPCAQSIMIAFLDNPTKPVDRICAAQTVPPTFTTN
jgi:hypothetical protein